MLSKLAPQNVTGEHIVIATGHTPRYPDIPGEPICLKRVGIFWTLISY